MFGLSSQISVASVYVTDSTTSLEERDALVARVHELLSSTFDITHTTVEVVSKQHEHTLS